MNVNMNTLKRLGAEFQSMKVPQQLREQAEPVTSNEPQTINENKYISPLTVQDIRAFSQRKGINMAGICREADVAHQYVLRKLAENVLPGQKVCDKLIKVMHEYGF